MKRREDGRFQKRVTLPDGTVKYLYSNASNERLAVKDFNEQMLNLEIKEKNIIKQIKRIAVIRLEQVLVFLSMY